MKNNSLQPVNDNELRILMLLFSVVSLAEVIAEFYENTLLIFVFKPIIMPLLAVIYWKTSEVKNRYYLIGFFFSFLANVFFIDKENFNWIIIGAVFFLFYRIITIYLAIRIVKIKNYLPVFLGIIPFGFIFLYLTCLTIDELGNGLYIYIVQAVFMSFMAGFSLGSYMVDDNRKNYWLLLSSLLFTVNQVLLVLRLYYLSVSIFQPISMALFCVSQYAFYKFIILSEKED